MTNKNKQPSIIDRLFLNTLGNEVLCKYATNNVLCGVWESLVSRDLHNCSFDGSIGDELFYVSYLVEV
jgi:hypothetical protein